MDPDVRLLLTEAESRERLKLYDGSSAVERAGDWIYEANEWREANGYAHIPTPPVLRASRYDCHQRNPTALSGRDPSSMATPPRYAAEGDEWRPATPYVERATRRRMYQLRNALRPFQRPRIRACGFAIVTPDGRVGVAVRPDGRASYQGLAHCGSVHECPPCQMTIKAKRAEEISAIVEKHGHDRCALLTLTYRHGIGDDLKAGRVGLADAWRGMTRGAAWKRFKERHNVIGWVRSVEVTHGANGWHPHIHVLLLFADKIPSGEVYDLGADGVRWVPRDLGWVIDRWETMVVRYIGEKHRPDEQHGVMLSPCFAANYISKLGLEISDPGQKKGRSKHSRTALQIASDIADASKALRRPRFGADELRRRKARDVALWNVHAEAMLGARQLTWSRGLKERFGFRDRTDLEVAQEEEPSSGEAIVVGEIDAADWRTIRARRVGDSPAAYYCLTCAEKGGGPGLRKAIADLVSGRVGIVGA